MIEIRSFCNADLPSLLEIWNQHWSAVGPPQQVSRARFEQAVLARTFFEPDHLLLAQKDGRTEAWCHYAASQRDDKTAVICALCQGDAADPAIAEKLLSEVQKRISDSEFESIQVGLVRDQDQGYAGLEPIGHGSGIPVHDHRTAALLQQHGFSPGQPVSRFVVSARAYRPPVSRDALQLRRTSRITSDPQVIIDHDAHRASSQSHLDIEHYRLVDRSGQDLSSLHFWFSDPEAEVMSPSRVILDISEAHQRGQLEPAEGYLIAALIQSLSERSIETVETAVNSEKTELLKQLERLQFYREEEGACWSKPL